MSPITELQQDYLAEIYQASLIETNGSNGLVGSADLANRLLTSQSTVNRVIERLRSLELIRHERYSGVQLTPAGQKIAQQVLRRQAILETFLINVMGLGWHEVYPEARQIRHSVSDMVLNRMWEMAGQPQHSPFGEWIKAPVPEITQHEIGLVTADIQHDYAISRVLTRQADRLEYLAALGLRPGVHLHLLHKAPFNGPLQIQLEREYRIIGHELAQMMTVLPATA